MRTRTFRLRPDQREEIVRRVVGGERMSALAREFGVGPGSVRSLVISRGFPTRSNRLRAVDETAFDRLTDTSAYWIGLLMADGGIVRGSVVLSLTESTNDHVDAFRSFLHSEHAITHRKHPKSGRDQWRVCVSCKRLADALAPYGVVERKSATATASDVVVSDRNFWRGCMDGDGGVYIRQIGSRRYAYLRLSGSRPLMEQFAAYVRRRCPEWRGRPSPHSSIWQVQIGASVATRIITELYRDTDLALARKLVTARAVMVLGLPERCARRMEAAA